MEVLNQRMEYNKKDKIFSIITEKENIEIARYTYDGINNTESITGNLKTIYGFSDSEEDNLRYEKIIQAYKVVAIKAIEQNS